MPLSQSLPPSWSLGEVAKCQWLLCHCCFGLGGWVHLATLAGTDDIKNQSPKGQQPSYKEKCAVWPRLTLSSVKVCGVWSRLAEAECRLV